MSQTTTRPQSSAVPDVVFKTKVSGGEFALEDEIIVTSSTIDKVHAVLERRNPKHAQQLRDEYYFYFTDGLVRSLPHTGPINAEFHHELMGAFLDFDGVEAQKALLALHGEVGMKIGFRIGTWRKESTVSVPSELKHYRKSGNKRASRYETLRSKHDKREKEATEVSINTAKEIAEVIRERYEEQKAFFEKAQAERQQNDVVLKQNDAVLEQILTESRELDKKKDELAKREQTLTQQADLESSVKDLGNTSRKRKAMDIDEELAQPQVTAEGSYSTFTQVEEDEAQYEFVDLTESTRNGSLTSKS